MLPNRMARAFAAAVIVCVTALLAGSGFAKAQEPPLSGPFKDNFTLLNPPLPTPQTPFTDLEGRQTTLSDFRGQVVLLNFWATWCAPCVREMPDLDRLQAHLGGPKFTVIALSQDRGGRDLVETFIKRLQLSNLPIFLDPKGKLAVEMRLRGLPSTFLIDAKGQIVGGMDGAAPWDSPEAIALIEHYIKGAAQGSDGLIETAN